MKATSDNQAPDIEGEDETDDCGMDQEAADELSP